MARNPQLEILGSTLDNNDFSRREALNDWVNQMEAGYAYTLELENFDEEKYDPAVHNHDDRPIKQIIATTNKDGSYSLYLTRKHIQPADLNDPKTLYGTKEIMGFLPETIQENLQNSMEAPVTDDQFAFGPYSAEQAAAVTNAFDRANYAWELMNRGNAATASDATAESPSDDMTPDQIPIEVVLLQNNIHAETLANMVFEQSNPDGKNDFTLENARQHVYGTLGEQMMALAGEEFQKLDNIGPAATAKATATVTATAPTEQPDNAAISDFKSEAPEQKWWEKFDKPRKGFDPHEAPQASQTWKASQKYGL